MFEIEKTDDGAWVHTTHPETGKRISVYVNVLGSSDGIIVDIWREGLKTAEVREEDECIDSIGLDWSALTNAIAADCMR